MIRIFLKNLPNLEIVIKEKFYKKRKSKNGGKSR